MATQQRRPPRIIVIGAGISGLSFAYYLSRLLRERRVAAELRVFEAARRPGGRVWTIREGGYLVETGANAILGSKPAAIALAYELGLGEQVIRANPVARNRFIYLRGKLHPLPLGFRQFFRSELLSLGGKLRLAAEPFVPRTPAREDWSVARWAARRLGVEPVRVLVDAMCAGIYAAPPEVLSLRAAFPKLWELEQEGGSLCFGAVRRLLGRRAERPGYEAALPADFPRRGLWSLRGGMGSLIEALAAAVGDALTCGVRVVQLGKRVGNWVVGLEGASRAVEADWVVLATEAYAQAQLLGLQIPEVAKALESVRYVPVVVLALGFRRADLNHPLDGFGFLVPSSERKHVLGVLWSSSVFPDRAPEGHVLMRVMLGGYKGGAVLGMSDDELQRVALEELGRTMGVTAVPVYRRVIRWERAIPLLEPGHCARLAAIQRALIREPRLVLLGNFLHGVSVTDCVAASYAAATRVASALTFAARHARI